jgi:hypothetical protein
MALLGHRIYPVHEDVAKAGNGSWFSAFYSKKCSLTLFKINVGHFAMSSKKCGLLTLFKGWTVCHLSEKM